MQLRRRLRRLRDALLVLVLLCAAWQLTTMMGVRGVASPSATMRRAGSLLTSGDLWHHLQYTLAATVVGLVLGAVPAIILALMLRTRTTAKRVLSPFMAACYAAPKIALVPVLVVWFGIGLGSKMALVVSVVFFLVLFITRAGLEQVSKQLIQTARVLGANDRWIMREVVWPSALPYVFTAIRVAVPQAIGSAVVGEMISSNRGLGYMIEIAAADFDAAGVFVGLGVLVGLVTVINVALDRLEHRVLGWRPTDTIAADVRVGL